MSEDGAPDGGSDTANGSAATDTQKSKVTGEGGPLSREISRRRTFAIISHPDAGKTTLTEKLLLFGGAIQLAGQVKAKKDKQSTRSDWMAIEKARGISVATSVMTFEYGGHVLNLLDTPGHEDFADHTYRTLTAVDSAIMVIDAARGIEARTLKLFEICRLRDIPIITFVNKMDREAREPLEILDEIERTLALDTCPMVWPIGGGKTFRGTYDLATSTICHVDAGAEAKPEVAEPEDTVFEELLEDTAIEQWREEIELVRESATDFDHGAFSEGTLTPVYFGSALKNFGVRDLLEALIAHAPAPREHAASARTVVATEAAMTGVIFKIQANMDKNHRDRIAFLRLCSGRLKRGMRVRLSRTGKTMALTAPQFFFAQDRSIAEEAYAGDVVGIPNRGTLRIGDTLTEGEDITFLGIPSFAPEILRRIRLEDAIRAKKLKDALQEMAEEGVVQLFRPIDGSPPIVGVIGALQLDVLADRLIHEYGLDTAFEGAPCDTVRWVSCDDEKALDKFKARYRTAVAEDNEGSLVYLAPSVYNLTNVQERHPEIAFADVKTITVE